MVNDKWYLNLDEQDKSDIDEHRRSGHLILIELSCFNFEDDFNQPKVHADFHVFCASCHQGLASWSNFDAFDLNDIIGETLHG